MLTVKKSVPIETFQKGGKTTRKRYGKNFFSLVAKLRHEKDPRMIAKLKKEIAEIVAKRKSAKKK